MLETWRWLGVVGLSWVLGAGCSSDPSDNGTGGRGGSEATGQGGAAGDDGEGGAAGDTVAGQAGQEPGPPVQLRVATFNAENFFNDKKDSPEVTDETTVSASAYQTKLAGVAAILAKTNADIVMLEEIENDNVLADLQARPEFKGKFIDRAILGTNDPRGIHVAALSTVMFTKKISHIQEQFARVDISGGPTYRWSRDLLELHAQVNTRHLIFLGVHLKAKVDDDPSKRLAEAQRARGVADKLRTADPDAGVVILGDFNDFPGSKPIDAVEQGTVAGGETYGSAGLEQPAADAWSVKSSSAPGGLALHDDLRSSPWLQERIVKGSSLILHDDQLDKSLQSISDHAPVVITYRID